MQDMIQIDVVYPNPPRSDRYQHFEVEDAESNRDLIADEIQAAIEKGAKQIRLEKPAAQEAIRDWNRESIRVVQVGPTIDYVCLPDHCDNTDPHFHGEDCAGYCRKQYGPEHGQHPPVGYATLGNSLRYPSKGAVMVGPPGSPVPLSATRPRPSSRKCRPASPTDSRSPAAVFLAASGSAKPRAITASAS